MEDNKPHILTIMASLGTFVFLAGSLISGLILCYSLIEILLPEIDSFQVSGFEYGFIFFALSNATAINSFFPTIIILIAIYAKSFKRQLQVGTGVLKLLVIAIIIAISILIVAVSADFNNRICVNTGLPIIFTFETFFRLFPLHDNSC